MTLFNPSLSLPPRTSAAADRRDSLITLLQSNGFEITAKSEIDPALNVIMRVSLHNPSRNESALVQIKGDTSPAATGPLTVQFTIATYALYAPAPDPD